MSPTPVWGEMKRWHHAWSGSDSPLNWFKPVMRSKDPLRNQVHRVMDGNLIDNANLALAVGHFLMLTHDWAGFNWMPVWIFIQIKSTFINRALFVQSMSLNNSKDQNHRDTLGKHWYYIYIYIMCTSITILRCSIICLYYIFLLGTWMWNENSLIFLSTWPLMSLLCRFGCGGWHMQPCETAGVNWIKLERIWGGAVCGRERACYGARMARVSL